MACSSQETPLIYQKLPKGGIVAEHQPAMFIPTKRILRWLADVPKPIDLSNSYTDNEVSPEALVVMNRLSAKQESIWEFAAKRRKPVVNNMKSKVVKNSIKMDKCLVIDLTGGDDSELSGGRVHIKKRTRLNASGTYYRTTVKVMIDLTESDEEQG